MELKLILPLYSLRTMEKISDCMSFEWLVEIEGKSELTKKIISGKLTNTKFSMQEVDGVQNVKDLDVRC